MCYVGPIVNSIATTIWWKKTRGPKVGQLNLMFYGASVFGFVDHLWNGQLFFISPNIGKDLLLGVVISLCVWGIWGAGLLLEKFGRFKTPVIVKA